MKAAGVRPHYPSWGSGTVLAGSRARTTGGLITPHGDREHKIVEDYKAAQENSLPLMGIGNASGSCHVSAYSNSLPLMGIGNQRPDAWQWRRHGPHYPSWGSGTHGCG